MAFIACSLYAAAAEVHLLTVKCESVQFLSMRTHSGEKPKAAEAAEVQSLTVRCESVQFLSMRTHSREKPKAAEAEAALTVRCESAYYWVEIT